MEFSIPTMITYVKGKFRVVVFGYRAKMITWNFHFRAWISSVIEKFQVIILGQRAKNSNSELRIHVTRNSKFFENSKLFLWPKRNIQDRPPLPWDICLPNLKTYSSNAGILEPSSGQHQ